jgi:hypothetical protein
MQEPQVITLVENTEESNKILIRYWSHLLLLARCRAHIGIFTNANNGVVQFDTNTWREAVKC